MKDLQGSRLRAVTALTYVISLRRHSMETTRMDNAVVGRHFYPTSLVLIRKDVVHTIVGAWHLAPGGLWVDTGV